nr:ASN_HP1_G0034070.mRNA.1.CDS.1 [Saccharomyces cerevisiae]
MRSIVWSISSFLWFVTPTIVTAASFAYYIYVQGEVLTTPVAFTALSLFTLLRDPLDRLSDMLSFVAAWLLNDTVKNNILFNSPFNEARYKAVVEACGLKRDFEILKAGDLTEIGEKGITLSGGQKQRVSLARALYSNARHVLLDDCLSAVDSHTASWIYDNCITGPLMEDRTCILVSHNIALTLRNAELVPRLGDGRVKDQGDPIDMLQKGLFGEDELVKSSILLACKLFC